MGATSVRAVLHPGKPASLPLTRADSATRSRAQAAGQHPMHERRQRAIDNQAMPRLLARTDAESAANDAVAHVMSAPEPITGARAARPDAHGLKGQRLDPGVRAFMEPRFGRSFGDVRVFTDGDSAASARWMGADAYTVGRAIVFASGSYAPGTSAGRRLVAHELVHVVQQDDGGPLIQCQAGRGQPFDTAYRLYLSPIGTQYDRSSGAYSLSAWDLAHLVRSHGFYLFQNGSRSLIAPPEVRRAAARGVRGTGVLIPFADDAEYRRFLVNPVATVEAMVQLHVGIRVPTMTRATGPDRDFSIPAIPAPVAQALAGSGSASGAAARQSAAMMPQQRTLELAARRREDLPMQSIRWADRMSPSELAAMSATDRANWYVSRLGPYQAQLYEAAQRHHIPMQLLAVVILNELADINFLDWAQESSRADSGSLGIAQIQVSTAVTDRLVDTDPSEAEGALRLAGMHVHEHPLHPYLVQAGLRLRVAQQLQVPQVAIEAAAREIEILLQRMIANRTIHLWQQQSGFSATRIDGDAIYDHVAPGAPLEAREGALARMVAAAYNSPDIIIANAPGRDRYSNANIHGDNARLRAMEIYRLGLFHTQRPPAATAHAPISGLRFDGHTLFVNGAPTESFAALSGLRPNNPHNRDRRDHTGPASQTIPDVGPIPEGTYYIDPQEVEYGGFSQAVWGPRRIRIHETEATQSQRERTTERTGGFFIHEDVRRDGTAGCVGLQSSADTSVAFARIAQTPYRIPLVVSYPRPRPRRRHRT